MNGLRGLKRQGYNEINFSTGDEHQKWVPVERVINGTRACLDAGIRVVVVIEGHKNSKFRVGEFLNTFENVNNDEQLLVFQNVWMPIREDASIEHCDAVYEEIPEGCDSILDNIAINPHNELLSCCGLTVESIPALHLGDLRTNNIEYLYWSQFEDFLKLGIFWDGPQAILKWVRQINPEIPDFRICHPCQACLLIYQNSQIWDTLKTNYEKIIHSVLFRYFIQRNIEYKAKRILKERGGFHITYGG
ncbi:MAG: hypothetical protein QXU40_03605 [Candidatus Pacearchaeota archaeon]